MSTTVGGKTIVGGSSDEDQDMASDDGMDKITERSDATRLSKARSCCTKSSGRKQKRRERFLAYNAEKAAAAGEKFEIVDMAERKEAQRAAMLQFTMSDGTVVAGSVLDSLDSAQKIGEILVRADADKYTVDELMARKAQLDTFFMGAFVPRPTSQESVTVANGLVMTLKKTAWGSSDWWCELCGKWQPTPTSTARSTAPK